MDKRYFPLAGVVTVLLLLALVTWPGYPDGTSPRGLASSTARALVDPATVSYSLDPARGKLLQVQLVFRCASATPLLLAAPPCIVIFFTLRIVECTRACVVAAFDTVALPPCQLPRSTSPARPSPSRHGARTPLNQLYDFSAKWNHCRDHYQVRRLEARAPAGDGAPAEGWGAALAEAACWRQRGHGRVGPVCAGGVCPSTYRMYTMQADPVGCDGLQHATNY